MVMSDKTLLVSSLKKQKIFEEIGGSPVKKEPQNAPTRRLRIVRKEQASPKTKIENSCLKALEMINKLESSIDEYNYCLNVSTDIIPKKQDQFVPKD